MMTASEIEFALEYADQARSEANLEFATVSLPRGKYDTIRAHITALTAQRDALAQALRNILPYVHGHIDGDTAGRPWLRNAQAALAQLDLPK
jgi:hypothetical protein